MRKNGFLVMWQLLALVKPLAHVMIFTIIMGVLGFLAAIFIMMFAAIGLADLLGFQTHFAFQTVIGMLVTLAISRGILRYLEQMSGHYIAFKLLALLRDKVFTALRKLAFVKLQSKEAGQLLALVTNDIELLEVFYAHTIAPVMIAFLTSSLMLVIFAHFSLYFMLIALLAYLTIGVILPIFTTRMAREDGRRYRELVGEMNDYFLDSLRGMKEIQLFGSETARAANIQQRSFAIDRAFLKIKRQEGNVRAATEIAVSTFNLLILIVGLILFAQAQISFATLLVAVILLMSSYGPVIAISNLSNNLLQTLASGERVLALLQEEPELAEVKNGKNLPKNVACLCVENVSFAYQHEQILTEMTFSVKKGEILGIYGRSGSGKSTLLKLIMRFYDPAQGKITLDDIVLKEVNTKSLRDNIAYITQQTYVFNESIFDNIHLANRQASREAVIDAAQKANLHDFIMSLPQGYDTQVSEMGNSLSDGEKQRIGIARAFLYNAPIILLDEPTSNLDSLNEALILQALLQQKQDKIIILVSHRRSTMAICDKLIEVKNGRIS